MSQSVARTPDRRMFIAGSITLLLFSLVHMIPMFASIFIEPTEPLEVEARRAMRAVAVDLGPFHTHWANLSLLLSVSYSVLLLFVVALNLVALPAIVAHGRLRAMAAVNVIFVGILLMTAVIFQFPPPGVFALIAEVFFIAAMIGAKRTSMANSH